MKKIRRQQKDIDKARGRLFGWATHSAEGTEGIARMVSTLAASVSKHSKLPLSDAKKILELEHYSEAARILALHLWLKGEIGLNIGNTPLNQYIKERSWRETSTGKRWLKELAKSQFDLRSIVSVVPETSVKLGKTAQSDTPVTVYEPHLADERLTGLVVCACVLPMPAGAVIADGMVVVEPHVTAGLGFYPHVTDLFGLWVAQAMNPVDQMSNHDNLHSTDHSTDQTTDHVFNNEDNRVTDEQQEPQQKSTETSQLPQNKETREKLLARVRKLFAMAQEIEASPHEAEIALRRCQSLMAKFGISEQDLETSEFGRQTTHTGKRVPMHIQFLSTAVAALHDVIYVNGRGGPAHFRGYDIDTRVASLTLAYLGDAVERALKVRRRQGDFPPGRMAAYDYRLSFANEVCTRVDALVKQRKAQEQEASSTGTALTVRKLEIVHRECGQDLVSSTLSGRGTVNDAAAEAGRSDGSRVSLDPQVARGNVPELS